MTNREMQRRSKKTGWRERERGYVHYYIVAAALAAAFLIAIIWYLKGPSDGRTMQ